MYYPRANGTKHRSGRKPGARVTNFVLAELNVVARDIEIINNTRGGIVIFFTEKKRNAFIGGQIQVPDAGPGAYWLS